MSLLWVQTAALRPRYPQDYPFLAQSIDGHVFVCHQVAEGPQRFTTTCGIPIIRWAHFDMPPEIEEWVPPAPAPPVTR